MAWLPWGEEAFAAARAQNRPILLDIGAVWCHWCHVMDGESYENGAIADIINASFVAVKVDRDERPDVDARYQRAVQILTGQGGWPLTVFLTPDGTPFYGGTYFPPEARYGRAGFPQVLRAVAEAFATKRDQVEQQGASLVTVLRESTDSAEGGEASRAMIDAAIDSLRESVDAQHGGFGDAPKFPHTSAVDLLITRALRAGDAALREIVTTTLTRMAAGGVYDQIGGGFHRYSTDERWVVPHFEKMLYDNTELLRNYARAYAAFGDARFREIAEGIVRWMDGVLAQPGGGFGASQDADVGFGDDGAYFTWSAEQARAAVREEDFAAVQMHYNIYDDGEMRHDPAQNVLFVDLTSEAIAARFSRPVADVDAMLARGRTALAHAREARSAPFVDPTVYVGWNAMAVSAYFDAWRWGGIASCKEAAIRTLDVLVRDGIGSRGVRHVAGRDDVVGLLEDEARLIDACLAGLEATGERRYLETAVALADEVLRDLFDSDHGGFFDRAIGAAGEGILDVPSKPMQDSPFPSANAVMMENLRVLHWLTGRDAYREALERTVCATIGEASQHPLFEAGLVIAAEWLVDPPPHVVVTGTGAAAEAFHEAALHVFLPGIRVHRLSTFEGYDATITAMRAVPGPAAFVCRGTACSPPCRSVEELRQNLTS